MNVNYLDVASICIYGPNMKIKLTDKWDYYVLKRVASEQRYPCKDKVRKVSYGVNHLNQERDHDNFGRSAGRVNNFVGVHYVQRFVQCAIVFSRRDQ